ncbi:MAG TPA: tRNA lysidine(34) synthetase TilS, partial [Firmicutes bacterium]|nr:tRNA lysidine(34) synthetase TilS [Bacillota bacterium]
DFCIEVELNKSYNNESAAVSIKNRSYDIEEIGARVSLEVVHKDALSLGGGEQTLDYDKLVSDGVLDRGLIIRNRRDGDRFIVYKNGKAKKLKSFFIDLKINRDERGRIPLLCCEGEILAVIGVRASEKYKKTRSTENVLVITYERYEDR